MTGYWIGFLAGAIVSPIVLLLVAGYCCALLPLRGPSAEDHDGDEPPMYHPV